MSSHRNNAGSDSAVERQGGVSVASSADNLREIERKERKRGSGVESNERRSAGRKGVANQGVLSSLLPRRPSPSNDARESLVRVASDVVRPIVETGKDGSKRVELKRVKATTYDHVHDQVLTNFETSGSVVSGKVAGVVGLLNLGNTCFMNSSLQCLSNTIPLTDYFLGYDYQKEINKDNFLGTGGELVKAYAKLMHDIWMNKAKDMNPYSFKSRLERFAPQFRGRKQHDAQELLSFLLDGIHEDLNRVKDRPYIEDPDFDGNNDAEDAMKSWQNYLKRNKSIVVDLFQGQLRHKLECMKCGHRNIKFEPFMYLSVPIGDESSTLDDCLDLFCAEEELTGDDQWYCPKCKAHVDAKTKFDLWILPPILILHLKRFKYSDSGQRSKIDKVVEYPVQNWDLSKAMKSDWGEYPLYDLYAVSNHSGKLGFGHYTAYAMNRFDDEWYLFNDARVNKLYPGVLGHNNSAYCLFYNRTEVPNEHNRESIRNARTPLVRRQSVSRPDLWPHAQFKRGDFKNYQRSTARLNVEPDLDDTKGAPTIPEEDQKEGEHSGIPEEDKKEGARPATPEESVKVRYRM